jgi:hypothetical protein
VREKFIDDLLKLAVEIHISPRESSGRMGAHLSKGKRARVDLARKNLRPLLAREDRDPN